MSVPPLHNAIDCIPSEDPIMEKPCEVCGVVGFPELNQTCSKCKITRQHIYCMQINLTESPEYWVCDSCLFGADINPPNQASRQETSIPGLDAVNRGVSSKVENGPGLHSRSKWLKPAKTSKVKFISNEEVIKLSSGTLESKVSFKSKALQSKFTVSIPQRTSAKLRIAPSNLSAVKVKTDPVALSRIEKLPKYKQMGSMFNQQADQTSKESEGKQASKQSAKDLVDSKKSVVDPLPCCKVDSSRREIEKNLNKAPCVLTNISSEYKYPSVEERDLLNILLKLSLYGGFLPAPKVTWKGGFDVTLTNQLTRFFGGFQAQPPRRVDRKVYEFSQKMPQILEVHMVPQFHFWVDLFHCSCPSLQDIAFYFFVDDNADRSRQNISPLIEGMETHNLVMRSYIDGIELLIFTSEQLNLNLHNVAIRSKAEHFFWAFLREAPNKAYDKMPLFMTSIALNQENMDDSRRVDMEVDMIGGKPVGTIDIVVGRKSLICRTKDLETIQESALKRLFEKYVTFSRNMEYWIEKLSLASKSGNGKDQDLLSNFIQKIKSEAGFKDAELIGLFKQHKVLKTFIYGTLSSTCLSLLGSKNISWTCECSSSLFIFRKKLGLKEDTENPK